MNKGIHKVVKGIRSALNRDKEIVTLLIIYGLIILWAITINT